MLSKSTRKLIYSLRDKKNRDKKKLFIAEGPKVIKELIFSKYKKLIINIFVTKTFLNDHKQEYFISKNLNEKIIIIDENELKNISLTTSPNSIIALCNKPPDINLSDIAADTWQNWFLILEDVQEPGNVGTILRTAEWFGIKNIICSNCTADIFNPKTIQSSMGAIFNLTVLKLDIYKFLQSTKPYLYATSLNGDNIYESEFKTPGGIILGNESKGLKAKTLELAEQKITIPRSGKTQSLNISIAFGIVCSEIYKKNF